MYKIGLKLTKLFYIILKVVSRQMIGRKYKLLFIIVINPEWWFHAINWGDRMTCECCYFARFPIYSASRPLNPIEGIVSLIAFFRQRDSESFAGRSTCMVPVYISCIKNI